PNNPLSHYYFGLALSHLGREDKGHAAAAIAELRRATELAPEFARAHGQLALALQRDKNPEALAAARKAIELDNKNLDGRVVLLTDLMVKKHYIEAVKVYRTMDGLRDWSAPEEGGVADDFEDFRARATMDV